MTFYRIGQRLINFDLVTYLERITDAGNQAVILHFQGANSPLMLSAMSDLVALNEFCDGYGLDPIFDPPEEES